MFLNHKWADVFLENLLRYRGRAYRLHDYVLMPEHFHVLITPRVSLERALHFIKSGFSFRAKKELRSSKEVRQAGLSDHRIRGVDDYANHAGHIHCNPAGRKLVELASRYPYGSAYRTAIKDEIPQRLEPLPEIATNGAPEDAPPKTMTESWS